MRGEETQGPRRRKSFRPTRSADVSPGEEALGRAGSERRCTPSIHDTPAAPPGAGTVRRRRRGLGSKGVRGDPAEYGPPSRGPRAPLPAQGDTKSRASGGIPNQAVLVNLIRPLSCGTSVPGPGSNDAAIRGLVCRHRRNRSAGPGCGLICVPDQSGHSVNVQGVAASERHVLGKIFGFRTVSSPAASLCCFLRVTIKTQTCPRPIITGDSRRVLRNCFCFPVSHPYAFIQVPLCVLVPGWKHF